MIRLPAVPEKMKVENGLSVAINPMLSRGGLR
jgi:hypothetical protein